MRHRVLRTSAVGLVAFAAASPALALSEKIASDADLLWKASVTDGSVQTLLLRESGTALRFEVEVQGELRTVSLYPHSLRADDFQVLVQGSDGALVPAPVPAPTTYRGLVEGVAGSSVTASVQDGALHATLDFADGTPSLEIQPASDVDGGALASQHLVYAANDSLPSQGVCALDEHVLAPEPELFPVSAEEDSVGAGGEDDLPEYDPKICQIACDADYEFYQLNGSSVEATVADIEAVLNGVHKTYEKESEIRYEIGTIIVRDYEDDPYKTSNPGALLTKFRNYWNNNHSDVHRDIAHLFTGRDLNGSTIGIATLGVICNQFSGYGLSQSRYTTNMANRRALTAHELGHNWNSPHCDGDEDCAIMCSGLGGCTGDVKSFGTKAEKKIQKTKNNGNCLAVYQPAAPVLMEVDPPSVNAFDAGEITISGTNLGYVYSVRVGDKVLDASEYLSVSDSTLRLTEPVLWNVGEEVPIELTTLGGTSETISIEVQQGPTNELVASNLVFAASTGLPLKLKWGGPPGYVYMLVASDSAQTMSVKETDILATPSLLELSMMGGAGVGSLTELNPFFTTTTLKFQVWYFTPDDFCFDSATNIGSTFFLANQP